MKKSKVMLLNLIIGFFYLLIIVLMFFPKAEAYLGEELWKTTFLFVGVTLGCGIFLLLLTSAMDCDTGTIVFSFWMDVYSFSLIWMLLFAPPLIAIVACLVFFIPGLLLVGAGGGAGRGAGGVGGGKTSEGTQNEFKYFYNGPSIDRYGKIMKKWEMGRVREILYDSSGIRVGELEKGIGEERIVKDWNGRKIGVVERDFGCYKAKLNDGRIIELRKID